VRITAQAEKIRAPSRFARAADESYVVLAANRAMSCRHARLKAVGREIMLGLVQNWFAPRANPIGVDFGSDCLRLAQVQRTENDWRLVAAASADVPAHLRHDPTSRVAWFIETTRDLLSQGSFRGRQAVLAMPAASMFIQHLRLPKMDDAALKKALPWEARGKLPIDPTHALLRHMVAGDIYQDQEPKSEVIVMAAARSVVNGLLDAAAKARLDVVGMNVEPMALIDCFGHIYRRKSDAECVNCFVDIGSTGSRAVITQGRRVLLVRAIPIGGDHLTSAVADALKIPFDDARLLRIKCCHPSSPAASDRRAAAATEHRDAIAPEPEAEMADAAVESGEPTMENSFALLSAGMSKSTIVAERRETEQAPSLGAATMPTRALATEETEVQQAPAAVATATAEAAMQVRQIEQASREPLNKLVQELDLCRRYYEATFPNKPVDRLLFVGGEARQKSLCQYVAREMGLAAQLGDPMCRMSKTTEVGIESGIDRRSPQPAWAVAIGLSMGPGEANQG
jgi:type IV pilus assembly protein PilM